MEIYECLAMRYGYSVSAIRKKIAWMADTNIPTDEYNNLNSFFLYLHLEKKHKQSLLQTDFPNPDEDKTLNL